MHRRLTATVAVITIGLLAGACATGTAPQAEQAPAGGPADLTFWMTGSEDDALVMQKAADLYTRSHPNVKIKVSALSWDDGHAKVLAAATGKNGPDIVSGGLSWGIEFGGLGGMVDLREQGVPDAVKGKTQQGVWESITSPDGAVYGTPLDMTVYLTYYRKDLLEKSGLQPPRTWQELTAAIRKLRADGVKVPYSMDWGNIDWLQYFNFLRQAGGSLYTPDCEPALNDDAGVTALDYWAGLYTEHKAPTQTAEVPAALANGVAMVSGGSWQIKAVDTAQPKMKGKWATAPLPAGPAGPGAFIGGRIVGVMSHSKYTAQAADFIKSLYTPEAVRTLTEAAAARGVLWISPLTDNIADLPATPDQVEAIKAAFASGYGPPNCPGWETSQAEVTKKLQEVVYGRSAARTALDAAAKIMERNAG
ncbi:ABC-type glycerol-3-phosphate transport system substrate-binding protein [Streptosporangium becharense]|uniref:ABC-type glycerol-3-phosphate transport system substrate-binding protein n=1 Tax=Streptosporangium becharense TaxID=1816182 RepID=A0A7W9MEN8_9ACTN|nr:extracellular solute-binding protein [Streptosporangium becharense]MBB2910728.1 ABC-type glycerol-3-phosphate transport system substrate-binding protein [Streptosporangium becharense]MBB5817423.1 ABC-type glycerol-3-phosphate transport system substrate-binding protein [Streptosporangium becharense]